jgi:hypothetical protein
MKMKNEKCLVCGAKVDFDATSARNCCRPKGHPDLGETVWLCERNSWNGQDTVKCLSRQISMMREVVAVRSNASPR